MSHYKLKGTGLGLRQELCHELAAYSPRPVNFLELTPENWMLMGGWRAKQLHELSEHYPLITHGLSLSIGGPGPLDMEFLETLRQFFVAHHIVHYSEHLSYSHDVQGRLYDLLPMPFTQEAIHYVSSRIRRVQDYLGLQIALENPSYYCAPGQEMTEIEFIQAVLTEADCLMLLDVNNVYVNSVNHHYNPYSFIQQIPCERIAYVHIGGHWQKEPNLLIDTHDAPVIEPVWELLKFLYALHGPQPTVLERDTNIPPLTELLDEIALIKTLQQRGLT
ncbi:TPA: DUF692 family protein [Legionella pneumophila]|nr:DUF692 domain-containing protein [Legionella pneumophila]HAT1987736.1 DUF692 domain-containing protein [Legionella pneumophila]HAT7910039.1 DUF692 family protein [Legionella pneumophila]HAT7913536.1 DUF692 family protein [Legionella pneumophila]HAT7916617.1 DUF692 family protein [Legionella pneumophila]HAT7983339.1 DUF692 family protein [Legionella pneumophila]